MPTVDEDLRDRGSTAGALDHLALLLAAAIDRIFHDFGAAFRQQTLGPNAIGTPILGINLDLGQTLLS